MYIKFNPEKGRPVPLRHEPDNARQVAPSNESRTQVAVNNDGKANEAKESELLGRKVRPTRRTPASNSSRRSLEETGKRHEM